MKENSEDRLTQVYHLISVDRIEEAIRLCNSELYNDPENEELLYYLAYGLYRQNKIADAESTTRKLLTLYPDSYLALHIGFTVLKARQKFSDAELLIIQLIKNYPRKPDLYAQYANLLIQNFQFEKAKELIHEGYRLNPQNPEVLIADCLYFLTQGKIPQKSLSELVQLHPEQVNTCIILANTLIEKGKYSEAFKIYRELFTVYPNNQEIKNALIPLKVSAHPLNWILYPLNRFEPIGSLVTWVIAIGAIYSLNALGREDLASALSFIWLAYVIYSWTIPTFLKSWYKKRGF